MQSAHPVFVFTAEFVRLLGAVRSFVRSFVHFAVVINIVNGHFGEGGMEGVHYSKQAGVANEHTHVRRHPASNEYNLERDFPRFFFPARFAWLPRASVQTSEEAVSSNKQFGLISLGLLSAPKAKSRLSLRYSNPNGNYRQIN